MFELELLAKWETSYTYPHYGTNVHTGKRCGGVDLDVIDIWNMELVIKRLLQRRRWIPNRPPCFCTAPSPCQPTVFESARAGAGGNHLVQPCRRKYLLPPCRLPSAKRGPTCPCPHFPHEGRKLKGYTEDVHTPLVLAAVREVRGECDTMLIIIIIV